jgi:hypothetical protein
VQYRCAEGTVIHVYGSEYAGMSEATVAGWAVEDVERVVDELTEKGIATFEGGAKAA